MTYPKVLESYFENVRSLHATYMKYVMSTPGKMNKRLNIILYPFTRIVTIVRILFGRPSVSNMLVCSIINWQLSWGFCTISSNLLSTVHHCVCLERIFFVNGAQHSSQCGSYNLSSWLLWVELSCISTTNIIFQPCLRVCSKHAR